MKFTILIAVLAGLGPMVQARNNMRHDNEGSGRYYYRMHNATSPLIVVDPIPTLTDPQIADLLYMREEEKLARDVYAQFWNKYETRVFQNIQRSEQHHMDMMLAAMVAYGIPPSDDPVQAGAGVFTNQNLKAIYTDLTQGVTTLQQALRNSALIEETDILDLRDAITDLTGAHPTLAQVYGRMLRASENHLRAFARILENLGEGHYQHQHEDMDQDDVDDILDRGWNRGQGNGGPSW
jgi:hypothetical protein